jgi:U3 small nucleolar ribonucleoprotein protein IMP3
VRQGVKFIEQGHVRCGPEVITDPAFLVTRYVLLSCLLVSRVFDARQTPVLIGRLYRNMEDFVTWVDSSKIKRNILQYRDKLDDFDLL